MHALDCTMETSKPSEEGTACIIVPCSCGQWERDKAETQRMLDEQHRAMEKWVKQL